MAEPHSIVVVGSVNLDFVATVEKLPVAGETVSGAELNRFPGGKGANQALAARRLGANVSLVARVGDDTNADEALALLSAGEVDLAACDRDTTIPTGVALIAVSADGENQIVVAPGANRYLQPEMLNLPDVDALICQLEVPVKTLLHAAATFSGFFCVNLAPAMDVPDALIERADLLVVNETEAEFYGAALTRCDGLLATTFGAAGAELSKGGETIAKAKSVALLDGMEAQAALEFACAAGAAAATKQGAQPSLPFRADVEALIDKL